MSSTHTHTHTHTLPPLIFLIIPPVALSSLARLGRQTISIIHTFMKANPGSRKPISNDRRNIPTWSHRKRHPADSKDKLSACHSPPGVCGFIWQCLTVYEWTCYKQVGGKYWREWRENWFHITAWAYEIGQCIRQWSVKQYTVQCWACRWTQQKGSIFRIITLQIE